TLADGTLKRLCWATAILDRNPSIGITKSNVVVEVRRRLDKKNWCIVPETGQTCIQVLTDHIKFS
ncbi:MAG TPA: hypothetical protein PKA58_23600, partial [Polyangium sp.]|nr:hypothetical protein [Polyangium sp.]